MHIDMQKIFLNKLMFNFHFTLFPVYSNYTSQSTILHTYLPYNGAFLLISTDRSCTNLMP